MCPTPTRRYGRYAAVALAVLAAATATACDTNDAQSGGARKTIALLLPESKTTRYEAHDRPLFIAKVKRLCPDCRIVYSNADQDASKQQQQAEAAIANGADVLVLDPVDAASAAGIVSQAKQAGIPVVSYDRLILNADVDYYVSFDNERVGRLQARSLIRRLGDKARGGSIVMINGSPTDSNARLFKKGAHSVIDRSGLKVAKEYDTPDWSPDEAQQEMEQAITALGKNGFVGVYAANDGTAGGAIAAMKAAGIDPARRPVTGQDAELAAIQRILAGEQYMTVYKAIKPEADAAAELAVALLQGKQPPSGLVDGKVDNGDKVVPSVLLTPVVVTADNVKATVIKDGFWKPSQVCVGRYAPACAKAGIR